MFSKISHRICNVRPIYKVLLIAAIVVVILGILLSIGYSNHYYTIKCRDNIEEYSFKLHRCTSAIFNHTEGFKQLELSLFQYNFTRLHDCDLGFHILKCMYGIHPIDDDCDDKPPAERLINIHKVIVETIQFICIDSFDDYKGVEKINLDDCSTESIHNYDHCIKVQQCQNNVTELNSFMYRSICRNFDLKMVCNQNLTTCFNVEQQQLVDAAYDNLKLSFGCT